MSISHTRDMDPRIRILSCEATPPPRRGRDWRLPAAAVVVAVLGVGITLAVTSARQPSALGSQPKPPVAVQEVDVVLMAAADASAVRPTREVHRAIRAAASADLRGAARMAREPQGPQAGDHGGTATAAVSTTRVTSSSGSAAVGTEPAAQTPSSTVAKPAEQAPTGTVNSPVEQPPTGTVTQPESRPRPAVVGPERAPGAGDPVNPAQ